MAKRVEIIGAGVIGLTLAKELARSGIDVAVYDSKSRVSDNTAKASGIFSKSGLERIGIDWKEAQQNTLNGAVLYAGKETFRIDTGGTVAYILDRGIFAELCAKEAKEAGAEIVLGKRFTREQVLEAKSDEGTILVGADGAVSTVASAVGFPEIKEYILTYKAEYDGARVPDPHKAEVVFSSSSPRFFGWTVPYSDRVLEVGIGISSSSRRNSTGAFNSFAQSEFARQRVGSAKKRAGYASIIPLSTRKRTVIGNVLLVGDAAGQVKATTGGGIIFGTACAHIAAKSIVGNIKHGKPLSLYEREWRRAYGLDLKLHKAVHAYYSGMGERGFESMLRIMNVMGFNKFLGKYGDMDRPSLIIKRMFLRNLAK